MLPLSDNLQLRKQSGSIHENVATFKGMDFLAGEYIYKYIFTIFPYQ